MTVKKKRINTSPCLRLRRLRRYLEELNSLFTWFYLSPCLIHKRTWVSRPRQEGYFETLDCHLLYQLAFRIKSYSLPQHLISLIHCPLLWQAWQAWIGLGNKLITGIFPSWLPWELESLLTVTSSFIDKAGYTPYLIFQHHLCAGGTEISPDCRYKYLIFYTASPYSCPPSLPSS